MTTALGNIELAWSNVKESKNARRKERRILWSTYVPVFHHSKVSSNVSGFTVTRNTSNETQGIISTYH